MVGKRTENYDQDDLVFGDKVGPVTRSETLAMGQNLQRGALLGKVTGDGKLVLSDDGAADGSEVPFAILVNDHDATAADLVVSVYVMGEFNHKRVTFGGAHTYQSTRDGLRAIGIELIDPQDR